MKTCVDNWEVEEKASDLFIKSLAKHFSAACKVDGRGTLVCSLSSKSPFRRSKEVFIRVPSELVDNHGYLQAVMDTGVRRLISNKYD